MFMSLLFACGPEPVADVPPAPAPVPYTFDVPVGLPGAPAVPETSPMTKEKVALGHKLFMDPRLSVDGSRSCYSCHVNERGAADGRALALGAGDKPLARNTPTIWNVAYHNAWYWDGRATTLEAQAIGAWKGGNMGVGDKLAEKAGEIGELQEYRASFIQIYGLADDEAVTPDHVADALSAYERTLLCGSTAVDRGELSEAAARGKALFEGSAGCVACHPAPFYADGGYHDIGLGHDAAGQPIPNADTGRGKVNPEEAGRFRTPTLRNVTKTAPYFHDGRAATIEEAVRYMAVGNPQAPTNDPALSGKTPLTDDQVADLVAFLDGLTCPGTLDVLGDPKPVATN